MRGRLRPPMRQADRAIDWMRDNTALIVRKIRAADSAPGVLGTLLGKTCFLYGVHEEERLNGPPGQVLAKRDGAICIGTIDGAVWISHLKAKAEAQGADQPRPAGIRRYALPRRRDQAAGDAGLGIAASRRARSSTANRRAGRSSHVSRDRLYARKTRLATLSFDFYNGAMSTSQCSRLRDAFLHARSRPTQVIVLLGGADFWSNGIDLNTIEASADPATESWRNINAIDDLIFEILNTMSTSRHRRVARQCRSRRRDAGACGGPRLCEVWGRPQPPLQEHGRSLRIGILDLYAATAGGAEAGAGTDPVVQADRHAGGAGRWDFSTTPSARIPWRSRPN